MSEHHYRSTIAITPARSASPPGSNVGVMLPRAFAAPGCLLALAWLLTAGTAESAAPNGAGDITAGVPAAARNQGPTVLLSYSKEKSKANLVSSFLYFLPLISMTPVDREASAGNNQKVTFVSHDRKVTGQLFHAVCDFDIRGTGFHKYRFDTAAMIAARARNQRDAKPLVNLLDYVKFEGEGFGRIVIKGRVTGSAETIDQVDLQFHARGKASPVTIGLYDVKPQAGRYDYANRSNESIARVSTLTFKRSEAAPTMGVTVDTIAKAGASEGLLAGLRGAVANLFLIKPPRIDAVGNKAVLDFGSAIAAHEPEFTFPKAKSIREAKAANSRNP